MRYRSRVAALSGVLAAVAVGGIAVPARAASPSYVPCPIAPIQVHRTRPPRPSPPPRDPGRPVVGGAALGTAGLVLPAGAGRPPANLTATSWVVADLDTGAVLAACGPHEQSPPASVQKLLLAATLLPKLDNPAQVVQVTAADVNVEAHSSAVGLVAGGRYPLATLWLGLFLESGNDAANALARLGGGPDGVAGTLAQENALARHLGALDTHAVTPSGLDGPGQFTSAYDLALIARADFALPDFRRYDAALTAQIPAQPPKAKAFQIQNENKLLTHFPGALGGKTGFTDLARHTYVGAAQRGGRRLVVTLLDAEPEPVRGWQQGASLLEWGFSLPRDASVGRLVDPGETGASPTPPRPVPAAAAGTGGATATRASGFPLTAVSTVAAGVVLVPALLVLALRRRAVLARRARTRARRAGGAG